MPRCSSTASSSRCRRPSRRLTPGLPPPEGTWVTGWGPTEEGEGAPGWAGASGAALHQGLPRGPSSPGPSEGPSASEASARGPWRRLGFRERCHLAHGGRGPAGRRGRCGRGPGPSPLPHAPAPFIAEHGRLRIRGRGRRVWWGSRARESLMLNHDSREKGRGDGGDRS